MQATVQSVFIGCPLNRAGGGRIESGRGADEGLAR